MPENTHPLAAISPACLPLEQLLKECETKRTRASGPGGQHRNKVETAIVLTHRPTGIIGQASERRSQDLNRQMAIQRLRTNLAVELPMRDLLLQLPPVLHQTPSPLWLTRAKGRQISVSSDHADFPALLAEALLVLWNADFNVDQAAARLKLSNTQFVGLLALEPRALGWLNMQRASRGLKPLKGR